MAKAVLIAFVLLLTGCGKWDFYKIAGVRKFKVGDCVIISASEAEPWEVGSIRIVELGRESYRAWNIAGSYEWNIRYGTFGEGVHAVAKCPSDKGN